MVFGSTQFWLFQDPTDKKNASKKTPPITFEFAQEEIAAKNGIDIKNLADDDQAHILQEEMLELMPAVEEATSISAELDKKCKFELMILSPQMVGKTSGKTEVQMKISELRFDYLIY